MFRNGKLKEVKPTVWLTLDIDGTIGTMVSDAKSAVFKWHGRRKAWTDMCARLKARGEELGVDFKLGIVTARGGADFVLETVVKQFQEYLFIEKKCGAKKEVYDGQHYYLHNAHKLLKVKSLAVDGTLEEKEIEHDGDTFIPVYATYHYLDMGRTWEAEAKKKCEKLAHKKYGKDEERIVFSDMSYDNEAKLVAQGHIGVHKSLCLEQFKKWSNAAPADIFIFDDNPSVKEDVEKHSYQLISAQQIAECKDEKLRDFITEVMLVAVEHRVAARMLSRVMPKIKEMAQDMAVSFEKKLIAALTGDDSLVAIKLAVPEHCRLGFVAHLHSEVQVLLHKKFGASNLQFSKLSQTVFQMVIPQEKITLFGPWLKSFKNGGVPKDLRPLGEFTAVETEQRLATSSSQQVVAEILPFEKPQKTLSMFSQIKLVAPKPKVMTAAVFKK